MDINEALSATWQDGLLQIEAFYGDQNVRASVNNVDARGGQVNSEAWSEGMRDVLAADDESRQVSVVVGEADWYAIPPNEPAVLVPEPVEETLEAGAEESGLHEAVDDSLDDRMKVDHVMPSDDATESAPPAQPHFTDQIGRDTGTQDGEKDNADGSPAETRLRADSMNLSLITNKEEREQQSEPDVTVPVEESKVVEEALKDDRPSAPPQESSHPPPDSSLALPIRPASAEHIHPHTPEQRPHATTDTMIPKYPAHSAESPSSEGKSSLMHEMRKEDEHACPNPPRSGVETGKEDAREESPATEDDNEFMDALSSPVGLTERLREVKWEEEGEERGDVGGGEGDGMVEKDEKDDLKEKDEEMTEIDDEVEAAGEQAQGKEKVVGFADVAAAESEQGDVGNPAGKNDGETKDITDATETAGLAAHERKTAYVGARENTELDAEAADRLEHATMKDVRPDLEPEPENEESKRMTKNKKASRARKSTSTKTQARRTRHSSVAATLEAPTTNDMSPASNIMVRSKMVPKDPLRRKDEMSEDELASSSPQTMSKKRRASSPKRPAGTKSTRGAKKAKMTIDNGAANSSEPVDTTTTMSTLQESDPTSTAPSASPAPSTTHTTDTALPNPNPTKKRKPRAEIRGAERPKRPLAPVVRGSIGVHELRDMSNTFLSADGEAAGGGIGRNGVAGAGRKTRAQMEKEEVERKRAAEAEPNAGRAIRARGGRPG